MTEKYDEVARAFAQVDTLEVPRALDPGDIAQGGRRRLRRRQTGLAVGSAALATGLVAVLAGIVGGGLTGSEPPAGGVAPPTPGGTTYTMDPRTGEIIGQRPDPGHAGAVADTMVTMLAQQVKQAGPPPASTLTWEGTGPRLRVDFAVPENGRAGQVALVAELDPAKVAKAGRGDPCAIDWQPKDGKGANCEVRDGYAIKTWAGSEQGRTVLIRITSAKSDLMLIQSQGIPPLDPAISAPGVPRKVPPLPEPPLSIERQLEIARRLSAIR